MKKNKGFTLIELLAVIIIIGLLAVLIIPKVNDTLNKSKESINNSSLLGLVRSAEKYFFEQKTFGSFQACTYNFTSNINSCSGLEFSGDKPESGVLVIDSKGNIGYDLYIGESYFKKTIIPFTKGIRYGNLQYYTGGEDDNPDNVVYFDPINGIKNCSYHVDNSTVGFNGTGATENQTSCLKWFVYSIDDNGTETEDDDVVNMILDHNTTSGIAWNNESGNSSTSVSGPDSTFKSQLTSDTSGWTSDKLKSQSNYITSWDFDENENGTIDSGEHHSYTITYTKARLINADEIARIKGDVSWIYGTSIAGISINNYAFLNSNLSNDSGYWTSSPCSNILRRAWFVNYDGNLNSRIVNDSSFGIRPVISVSLSDVL